MYVECSFTIRLAWTVVLPKNYLDGGRVAWFNFLQ